MIKINKLFHGLKEYFISLSEDIEKSDIGGYGKDYYS